MRMWNLRPILLCRQHLLGEHREMHTAAGSLRAGRSLGKHIEWGQIQTELIKARHDELVIEMLRREYNHYSPIRRNPTTLVQGRVVKTRNLRELFGRCEVCRERIYIHANSYERRILGI